MIACEDVADDKLDFDYQEYDGFIYITGYRGAGGNVIIPSKIDGKPVTCIGAPYDLHGGAFKDCTSLTGITIPNGVTSIEEGTFDSCTGFTSVTIPASVTKIILRAFEGCTSLTSVTFAAGSNITDFRESAFPEGNTGEGGNSLRAAYQAASTKAGTYTRPANGSTWTKSP
jgi:hypothetical protein